jgi:hypothetical protein
MKTLSFVLLTAIVSLFFYVGWTAAAHADDAGSGSAVSASAPAASQLHDPVSSPAAAFDDVKAAKKFGWLLGVLAAGVVLSKAAGRLIPKVSWLNKGKVPVITGVILATLAGCYDAAASGGSWTAVAFAALLGLAHYRDASPSAGA